MQSSKLGSESDSQFYHFDLTVEKTWDPDLKGETWLMDRIEERKKAVDDVRKSGMNQEKLTLPTNAKGEHYSIDGIKGDQKDVICCVLAKLKEWVEYSSITDPNQAKTFTPMRLTVRGAAGSGKSYLTNSLATVLRKIFNYDDVVHVAGPTGECQCFTEVLLSVCSCNSNDVGL